MGETSPPPRTITQPSLPPPGTGWAIVASYAAVAGSTQLLWLTYAPITTGAARHYGVSETAIGWLANAFPLLFVVLAIPAGLLLDAWLRPALLSGAVLTGAAGLLRLGGDSFGWALAGQTLVAVAQPLVLGAITATVHRSVHQAARTAAIALSTAGIFLGMVLALVLGAAFGADRLHALLVVQALIGLASALALVIAVRHWNPAAEPDGDSREGTLRGVVAAWQDAVIRRLALLALAGFGVFVALTTWLQALVEPDGVSETSAGVILAVAVSSGVVAAAVVPDLVARRDGEAASLRIAVLVAAAGCLALAGWRTGVTVAACAVIVVGAMLVALPILLDLCERRPGHHPATAANLIWMAGNLGGLVVALVVGALLDHPNLAFAVLALVALAALPLLPRGVFLGASRSPEDS